MLLPKHQPWQPRASLPFATPPATILVRKSARIQAKNDSYGLDHFYTVLCVWQSEDGLLHSFSPHFLSFLLLVLLGLNLKSDVVSQFR